MGAPRTVSVRGAHLDGVIALRSLEDARRVRERRQDATSIVVVGGGFVGLEVAATAVSLGKRVPVVEVQNRLLARAVASPLASVLAEVHPSSVPSPVTRTIEEEASLE